MIDEIIFLHMHHIKTILDTYLEIICSKKRSMSLVCVIDIEIVYGIYWFENITCGVLLVFVNLLKITSFFSITTVTNGLFFPVLVEHSFEIIEMILDFHRVITVSRKLYIDFFCSKIIYRLFTCPKTLSVSLVNFHQ